MARLVLIAVLLVQSLAAQAATAGMTCTHATAKPHAGHSMGLHHWDQHAAQPDAQSNCDCHCAIAAGHCAGSMAGLLASPTALDLSLRRVALTSATSALASGYRTPLYRPPSAIA